VLLRPPEAERAFWRSDFYCQHIRSLDKFLIVNSTLVNCFTGFMFLRRYPTAEPWLLQWALFATFLGLLAVMAWQLHRRPQQYCRKRNLIVLLARLARIAFIVLAYR
jgi:hypothetical protein